MQRFILVELPMILSYFAIFYFSSLSYIPILDHFDKVLHFTAFFVLTVLTLRTFYYRRHDAVKHRVYAFIIVTLYAISDEVHQLFVPNRFFDYWDWFADLLGAITALVLFSRILKFEKKLLTLCRIDLST